MFGVSVEHGRESDVCVWVLEWFDLAGLCMFVAELGGISMYRRWWPICSPGQGVLVRA